ncbi:MAG: purine-nucleoside phosphorylase [Actinobacteria bacterium]|nr:purine-nucleoside phosphorylase [Actinomycetota bacterium]
MLNPKAEAIALQAAALCAADALRAAAGDIQPRALVILGSGLHSALAHIEVAASLPFTDVPGIPQPSVEGHSGHFIFGHAGDTPVLVMQGRLHAYEGHSPATLATPTRAASLLGADTLFVTAAAGGIAPGLSAGDVVLLEDHIDLTGSSPLRGPNAEKFGPRFPAMAHAYTPRLRALAHQVAAPLGIDMREGVYAGMRGPAFETPAEARMLRTLGADVVGMSVVPEVISAVHAGMDVLGIALVTNIAASDDAGHEGVLEVAAQKAPALSRLFAGILSRL